MITALQNFKYLNPRFLRSLKKTVKFLFKADQFFDIFVFFASHVSFTTSDVGISKI